VTGRSPYRFFADFTGADPRFRDPPPAERSHPMNHATKWLLRAAEASLAAWQGEEPSVIEEHRELIDDLEAAIFYFHAHGATQPAE
jgi:hypothetical protein